MSPTIAVIGGTGFYELLSAPAETELDTPFGSPSAPIATGTIGSREVAFLPRHGKKHEFLPHEVPYRANLWALRELGVEQILGFNTIGSLQAEYRRGDFVLCDQFIERTWGRADTFYGDGRGAHLSPADPFCERLRRLAAKALAGQVGTLHSEATVVVTQGPRFQTRAESRWFRSMGWHVLNMTIYPEVVLARELELCYMNLSYVTDFDVAAAEVVGEDSDESVVSHHAVLRAFSDGAPHVLEAVRRVIDAFTEPRPDCACASAMREATT
jgi:5'-methylthioadenosine phosphorylase